eukprot:TRINITY_DN41665_c0_g1_i1.p1 TRINITY_DN41665_c0_g1~~TRINITY_DN41665_c0_g1_i1.p1  ORF type:complete len:528 (-),score=79.03 TRINITY_DN41665_c0_g1_i1:22-1605(-)
MPRRESARKAGTNILSAESKMKACWNTAAVTLVCALALGLGYGSSADIESSKTSGMTDLDNPSQFRTAAEYFTAGVRAHQAGRLEEALQAYEKAIARSDGRAPAAYLHNRGGVFYALGHKELALKSFQECLNVDSQHTGALRSSAALLLQSGQYSDATDAYERLLALTPKPSDGDISAATWALAQLGGELKGSGLASEALKVFDRALALDPTLVGVWYNRGYALQQLAQDGHHPLAILARESYDKAVSLDPNHGPWPSSMSSCDEANSKCREGVSNSLTARSVVQLRWPSHLDTLVFFKQLAGEGEAVLSVADNQALRNIILHLASSQASASVSNQGGWHSGGDGSTHFLGGDADVIARLRLAILEACSEHLLAEVQAEASGLVQTPDPETGRGVGTWPEWVDGVYVSFDGSWANVNEQGHSNKLHDHGGVTISGCYYVSSGYESSDESDNKSTALHVAVPTGYAHVSPVDAQRSHQLAKSVMQPIPRSGLPGGLFLWPGYVRHQVLEHAGSLARVSIAFNIFVSSQ